jgi:hypothetical protein
MKSDETSSMGTGASFDSQPLFDIDAEEEEENLEQSDIAQPKTGRVRAKSTISLVTGSRPPSQGAKLTIKEKQALKKAQQSTTAAAKQSLPNILESEELVIPPVSASTAVKPSLSLKQKQALKKAQQAQAVAAAALSTNPPSLQFEQQEEQEEP